MLSVDAIGAQLTRHPPSSIRPPAAVALRRWRTNLTALSSSTNLYLVAYAAHILAFEPLFPQQALPSEAALIVYTPPSAPNLRGYIDRLDPHTINHLVVAYLGSEEVVAVVRDDGDVDAYLVRHLVDAIRQRQSRGNALTPVASELRPILHKNVGNSAWGLAVHSTARLIAVSSNNHEINVFSFGLIDDADDGDATPDSKSRSRHAQGTKAGRFHDEHIRFSNGTANVPHIAFCNTGHDPDARWLLSTDITGQVRSWDLHARNTPQAVYVGRGPSVEGDFNRLSSGWTVSFLDPRAFQEVHDLRGGQFCPDTVDLLEPEKPVWDLTGAGKSVVDTDTSLRIPALPQPARPRLVGEAILTRGMMLSEEDPDDENNGNDPVPNHQLEKLPGALVQIGSELRQYEGQSSNDGDMNSSDDDGPGDPAQSIVAVLDAGPPTAMRDISRVQARRARQSNNRNRFDWRRDADYASHGIHWPNSTGLPLFVQFDSDTVLCPSLPCPIFLTSISDMYLLQPPTTTSTGSATQHFPIILHGETWYQHIPNSIYFRMQDRIDIEMFDRCSLMAQIPSLGAVVVGNQKGRVAVLSCFKSKQVLDFPVTSSKRVKEVKWVYGLKLEAILPFASQERAGLRPLEQLYGIATAPVQGCEANEGRFRLMCMWFDETVLSYEISRRKVAGVDVGLDVVI